MKNESRDLVGCCMSVLLYRKEKFEQALDEFDQPVDVTFKSFQLDPSAPQHSTDPW